MTGQQKWHSSFTHNGLVFPEAFVGTKGARLRAGKKVIALDDFAAVPPLNMSLLEAFSLALPQMKKLRKVPDEVLESNLLQDLALIHKGAIDISSLSEVNIDDLSSLLHAAALSKEEKIRRKRDRQSARQLYGNVNIDGDVLPVKFAIPPPQIFIGKAGHPRRGKIKGRILPADVTLNSSVDDVPCYHDGSEESWGKIVSDTSGTWIARWQDPVNLTATYLGIERACDPWVTLADRKKFENARFLNKNISKLRRVYQSDLTSGNTEAKKLALAVYLLDKTALRPGGRSANGAKGITTIDCCEATVHGDVLRLAFKGKSGVPCKKAVPLTSGARSALRDIISICTKGDRLLDGINKDMINQYLKEVLGPCVTSKTFRTWKASTLFEKALHRSRVEDPAVVLHRARERVAEELNHRKAPKESSQIQRLSENASSCGSPRRQRGIIKALSCWQARLESEENLNVNTGKDNYIDPRILVSWAKQNNIKIGDVMSRRELTKFCWALDVPSSWQF